MIEINSLRYTFQTNGFSIQIPALRTITSGITALVGKNGAGKTTLLSLLSGMLHFTEGEVKIFDKDIRNYDNFSFIKQKIFYLPDENILFDSLTIKENFELFGDIRFNCKNEWLKYNDIVAYFGLDEYINMPFRQCSHGTRKKAEIVCVFISSAEIIYLDEPFNGLDIISIKLLNDILKDRLNNKCIIISAHIVDILERIAQRVLILDKGVIIDDITLPISERLEEYYIKKITENHSIRALS